MQRKTGYRPRRKKREAKPRFENQDFRQGRTYADFEKAMKCSFCDADVVKMDTVKGVRKTGKRLLTMIFRNNSKMLLFLLPDGTAASVKRVFDYLGNGLDADVFRRLSPVILTDNGSDLAFHILYLSGSRLLFHRSCLLACLLFQSFVSWWQKQPEIRCFTPFSARLGYRCFAFCVIRDIFLDI